ncbi:alkaline phosphatase family protein [Streptomyces sp. NPDC046197]|uniref:alkaline phosphatase family protein n=1 Tax=Streptomyces sp. NPDC046197 TaxID=3154337 RepID=UPI0033D76B08
MQLRWRSLGGLFPLLGALIVCAPAPAQAAGSSGNPIVNGDAEVAPPASKVPGYDHAFMVMMENTDYSEVMNDPYEQGMGTPCNTNTNHDKYYEPDDAPFINYTDISGNASRCAARLFGTSQLTTDLQSAATTPNFSWIAADDYYDGEASGNGNPTSLKTQDGWLKQTLAPVLASPAWTQQRSLLILTWDESDKEAYAHVGTVVLGSQGTVPGGTSSPSHYDHYGIARTIESAHGLPGLTANDTYATPLNAAFAPSTATTPTLTRRPQRGHERRQRHLPLHGAVRRAGECEELDRHLPGGRHPGPAVLADLG